MRRARESLPLAGPRLLLLCNLLLVFVAALGVWRYDRATAEQRFLRLVEGTNADLQGGLDLTVSLLRGVLGLFEASREVELGEFRAYVSALDLRRSHPSLLGLGYAKRVGPDEVAALEARMQQDGEPEFRVWPTPASEDDAAIIFLEPPDRGNRRALGYVMTSHPLRRRAMEEARDTARGVASEVVTLVQEEMAGQPGFLIFFPHYATGASLATVADRRAALEGYVYSPVRIREVFEGARHVPDELGVRAYDDPDPRVGRVLYDDTEDVPRGATESRQELRVAGQTWTVVYYDRLPVSAWWRSPAWLVVCAGVLLSGLLHRIQGLQIQARLRAERDAAALREGERRYRFLADAMPQVVFTTDAEGRLAYTNGRWPSAVLGESLARNLVLCLHPDDRSSTIESWSTALTRGSEWTASFRMWCPGDEVWRWSLGRALPQRVEARVAEWVGTLTDIEAQKQAEAALQRETVELEHRVQERTAELERSVRELQNFAAVASHDLQEPLRKIIAFGDRLSDELGAGIPPAAADALLRMRRAAQRLQELIGDLLTFARVSRAEVVAEPVAMEALVREVRDELLEGRTDGTTVEVEALPTASGDARLLRQLVVNLLENAIKFHRPGEPARVRVYAEDAGDEVDEASRAGWFRLLVEDQGIGFDPKYLQRIFQVFQRLHPWDRYEGTGVGLAICQRVVELHGGRITARSSPSAGACFVATLPRAPVGTRNPGCAP